MTYAQKIMIELRKANLSCVIQDGEFSIRDWDNKYLYGGRRENESIKVEEIVPFLEKYNELRGN